MELTWIELKLESKDSLLAWVGLVIELSLSALHIRSRLFMATLTDKSCWALVAQVLPWCYFVGVFSLSLSAWAILKVGISSARCHSWSSSDPASANVFIFYLPLKTLFLNFHLKLCNRIQDSNCNKVKFLEYFVVNILVCDVLCVITLIMAPYNDPACD
jgi:hypothetical protein